MPYLFLLIKILLGNLLIAFSVNAFILPFSFVSTGSTGIAMVLNHFTGLPFAIGVALVSLTCFILGLVFMGWKFAMTTIVSSVVYPLFVELTAFVTDLHFVSDALISAMLAGIIMGIGLGIIIQAGASSGGMDIPPLILQRYFHVPLAAGIWMFDITILLLQVSYSSILQMFCGVVLLCCYTMSMNHVLSLGKAAVQIMVMTRKPEAIRQALLKKENKGASLFLMESGYEGRNTKAVCSVFPRKDLARIRNVIYSLDPDAFMIVSNVQEVRGMHFKGWTKKEIQDFFLQESSLEN